MFRIFRHRTLSGMAVVATFAAMQTLTSGAEVGAAPPSAVAPAQQTVPVTARDQVPDLVTLPLQEIYVAYENGRKVLRFSVNVENRGDGPLEVVGSRSNMVTSDLNVVQNIYQTDGRVRPLQTSAIMRYSLYDKHNHFHLQDFAQYQLRPVGSQVWRGAHKEGFCLGDDGNLGGQAPYHYKDCGHNAPKSLRVVEGISVGWVDVYSWYLWGQFIYLDGLRLPGDFCLSAIADPLQHLIEKARSNNTASALIHITPVAATVIRQGC